MKLETIELKHGHKLVDNTMNDYYLHCPEHGGDVGFAHWGQVGLFQSGKGRCWHCGLEVGVRAEVSITQPTVKA